VRIIGRSRGQNIRGIRHRQYRPDLIIVDDPENLKQVKKKENRDSTQQWFNGEVVPAQQSFNAKLVVIGNLLHNDGFIARLSRNSLFKVLKYPIVDDDGIPLWLAKYPTKQHLTDQRTKVGNTAYSREYALKIVSEEDQIISESDIHYYENELLDKRDPNGKVVLKIKDGGAGVDLAISEKQTADYTAMVSGIKVDLEGDKLLIKPNVVKRRMNFDVTLKTAEEVSDALPHGARLFVEDVGYQRVAIQSLQKRGLSVVPMRPITDKRARLQSVSPFIKDGTVMFARVGCEGLIQSLINFGIEEHEDDVDALVYLILGLINKRTARAVGKFDKL
jgi:predicted phage terminase large subunit-like protein